MTRSVLAVTALCAVSCMRIGFDPRGTGTTGAGDAVAGAGGRGDATSLSGTIDPTFIPPVALSPDFVDTVQDIIVDGLDRVIIAAYHELPAMDTEHNYSRYLRDGALDTTFGTGGYTAVNPTAGWDIPNQIIALSGGGYAATGELHFGDFRMGYVLLQANGDLNQSLDGVGWRAWVPEGGGGYVRAEFVREMGDGTLLFGGYKQRTFSFSRMSQAGVADTGFGGGDGEINHDFYNNGDPEGAFHFLPVSGERMLVAGMVTPAGRTDFALAMFNVADGSIDTASGFGGGTGLSQIQVGDDASLARRIFADPTGGYLVFGSASKGGLDRGALVFVDDLGAVDTSKGTDGFTFYDWTPNHCYVLDVVEEPGTGMFYLAGSAWDATGDPDSAVMRIGADGLPDPSFGDGGLTITNFSNEVDRYQTIAFQSDGRIILGGLLTRVSEDLNIVRMWP